MTDAEWLACRKPPAMLRLLGKAAAGRRLQLFLCGVGRILDPHLADCWKAMLDVQERFADGELETAEYASRLAAAQAKVDIFRLENSPTAAAVQHVVLAAVSFESRNSVRAALEWGGQTVAAASPECLRAQARADFHAAGCDLIRELFPPPERAYKVQPAFVGGGVLLPDGSTFQVPPAARLIADGVRQEQAYDRLPILADALEDADCRDRPLLDHLRHAAGHRRGCWALDLILGRG